MALARKTFVAPDPSPALHRLLSDSALWRTALGACAIPLAMIDAGDASRPVTYMNPAFEALFGYRADEALGRPLAALVFQGDEPLLHRLLAGASSRWKVRACGKDGAPHPVEVSLGAVNHADGRLTHWIVAFSDRSEVEKLRAELDALKTLAALP
ncbi:MAG: putative signaling protein [Burkholderiales bacterium]|nr:putative signaling protein [Burkholderiales bacterium]